MHYRTNTVSGHFGVKICRSLAQQLLSSTKEVKMVGELSSAKLVGEICSGNSFSNGFGRNRI